MSRIFFFRALLVVFIYSLAASAVLAQVKNPALDNPKYGADPATREECLKNTSFYSEYYKQNNYKDAAQGWAIAYTICPQSSENLYIRGVRMLKAAIAETAEPAARKKLVDSLMSVYDKRIQYFKKEGYNLEQKGLDLHALSPERAQEVYQILSRAMSLRKEETEPMTLLVQMQAIKDMYANQLIPADTVIAVYSRLSEAFGKKLAANPNDEKLKPMSESLDALFTSAGVANCENLVSIYTPKFESNPTDLEQARSIYNQLAALRCNDSELYLKVALAIFNAEPTPSLGLEIARIYMAQHKNAEADDIFKKAIAAESDGVKRSSMLVEQASFVGNVLGDMVRARALANEALALNAQQGYAYFVIGQLYASTKNCGSNKVDNASVYWAAVDKFNQAKSIDPALSPDCNKQIAFYSQYFPSTEEIFFQDMEVGKSFTVPCWINERTTVRAKN